MSHPAIAQRHPATTCPSWCTSDHTHDKLVPDLRVGGEWNALHLSAAEPVDSGETVRPLEVATSLTVQLEHFVSDTMPTYNPWTLLITSVDGYDSQIVFNATARQALCFAEVLVQQAARILAQQTVERFEASR